MLGGCEGGMAVRAFASAIGRSAWVAFTLNPAVRRGRLQDVARWRGYGERGRGDVKLERLGRSWGPSPILLGSHDDRPWRSVRKRWGRMSRKRAGVALSKRAAGKSPQPFSR